MTKPFQIGRSLRGALVFASILVGAEAFAFSSDEEKCIRIASSQLQLGPEWNLTVERAVTGYIKIPGPNNELFDVTLSASSAQRSVKYELRCRPTSSGMKVIQQKIVP